MTWSATQYLKFEDERTRPARDLLVQVPLANARRVVDVGCGPGNSTELLLERYPEAEIIGMDSSADMLASARKRLPGVAFVQADIRDWLPREPVDLIFANAIFQWVPDHLAVLARLMDTLVPGGVLALQIPDNFSEPSHSLMRESAAAGPWAAKLGEAEATREIIPQPRIYYDRLKPLSARVDVWHTVYNHSLESPHAIVEWLKSTGLRPYLAPLDAAEQGAYLADFESRIAKAYPPLIDGRVLLRFPRLFVVATKA